MEAHSVGVGVGSKDAEEESVAAAVPEPTVVDEPILQVKQAEAQFVCEVIVPTGSGPNQIEGADAAAAAVVAAQPVL